MKKGFTLIELLAVIVILAIISLIAVPIVINIINDSKTSSDEQSVELYLDTVEKTIAKKQLSNPSFNPDKCEIQDNGDLKCYKNNEIIDTLQIEMKGKMPYKGEIDINNNKFNYKNIWFNNKKYYSIVTLLDDADNNNEISIGDKCSYKVNDTDTFNFYVLSINSDNTVNLIMDRNICNDGTVNYTQQNDYCIYAWSSTQNVQNGPDTAMKELYAGTKNWTNVPNMNFSYDDRGTYIGENTYSGINIVDGVGEIITENGTHISIEMEQDKPIKARLPKRGNEVCSNNENCNYNDGKHCTGIGGSCPIWLVSTLRYYNVSNNKYSINSDYIRGTEIYNIEGYWLIGSSHYRQMDADSVLAAGCYGNAHGSAKYKFGVRPVITVPIEDLEQ